LQQKDKGFANRVQKRRHLADDDADDDARDKPDDDFGR